MTTEEYLLIHDLAEKANTTVRTIRYYTDEGLLPQPVIQGKYAYYSRAHLDRLELIGRMKQAYLPLREIRRVMLSLSDDEVVQRLQEPQAFYQAGELNLNSPTFQPGAQALEYIERLRRESGLPEPENPRLHAPVQQMHKIYDSQPFANRQASQSEPSASTEMAQKGTHWQRMELADGLELHVRQPVDPQTEHRLWQIIAFAQKLFRQK